MRALDNRHLCVLPILLILVMCSLSDAAVVGPDRIKSLILQKIYETSSIDRDSLNIEFVRLPKRITLPGDRCRVEVRNTNPRRRLGRLSFAVKIMSDSGETKKCWVATNVSATARVAVATTDLRSRSIIGPDDLRIEERTIHNERRKCPVSDLSLAVGKQIKRTLPRGRVLAQDMLIEPAIIKKRELTRLRVNVGKLVVSTIGIALKDGRLGETIPVKNVSSKKTVYGVVQADGTVVVLVNGA
ncbi:flagellar basal body P-ring formation protein FlgA [bacterium]|nr:flagellar basal body P-ring formation protein FlgA [bacterium]